MADAASIRVNAGSVGYDSYCLEHDLGPQAQDQGGVKLLAGRGDDLQVGCDSQPGSGRVIVEELDPVLVSKLHQLGGERGVSAP